MNTGVFNGCRLYGRTSQTALTSPMVTSILLILIVLMIMPASTVMAQDSPKALPNPVTFTDALGREVTVTTAGRVIAATASYAQVWLLAGGDLLGTTTDAFEDGIVGADLAENVGTAHNPNLEIIISLQPTLVILSADMSGHLKLSDSLSTAGITHAYFSVESFNQYLAMLDVCTKITGNIEAYTDHGLYIAAVIDELIARTANLPQPRVYLARAGAGKIASRNSGTMAGAMLRDMGAINIADDKPGLLEELSMEIILQEDPDYIFITMMGEAEEIIRDMLLSNPAWSSLTAVRNGRYVLLPTELFHRKPNARWGESYQFLWDVLYGDGQELGK